MSKNVRLEMSLEQFDSVHGMLCSLMERVKENAFVATQMGMKLSDSQLESIVKFLSYCESVPARDIIEQGEAETFDIKVWSDESRLCEHCRDAMRIIREQNDTLPDSALGPEPERFDA